MYHMTSQPLFSNVLSNVICHDRQFHLIEFNSNDDGSRMNIQITKLIIQDLYIMHPAQVEWRKYTRLMPRC